jgi:hypothetical protein
MRVLLLLQQQRLKVLTRNKKKTCEVIDLTCHGGTDLNYARLKDLITNTSTLA